MPKTIEDVTKALKLKADAKVNVLSLRIGLKKVTLPFEARLITNDKYAFVHIPPGAGVFHVTDEGLVPVASYEEAKAAQDSFRAPRKRSSREKAAVVEMPDELKSALNKIPSGYRLAVDPDGSVRLVKKRNRRKA